MSKNRVLRGVTGPKRGEWREDREDCIMRSFIRNLNSSPSIIKVNKSRRMRWARYAARMGDMRNAYNILV
jgi:hypothetical protein